MQTSGKSINTNAKEIEQFVGILVEMGILKYPQYRMYWDPTTRIPLISSVMGLTRFGNIKRYFHLNNNSQIPTRGSDNFDRLYKVRPLLDSILNNCKIPQEENQSIDEQVIPTKGRSSLRQYLPKKWRIKVWARCGVSGLIYDFDIYVGKQDDQNLSAELGKVGAVVIKLTQNLPKQVGHKLFMNNLFTSMNLFKYLKREGIWALGTMRMHRMGGAQKLLTPKKKVVGLWIIA